MHVYPADKKIMEMEDERKKDDSYKKYINKRFFVEDIHETPKGLCATIMDKEGDKSDVYYEGDKLADGKIQMVVDEGVVFKSPGAKQPPFTLKSKKEMLPVKGDKIKMKREELDEQLMMEGEQSPVMIISVMDDADSY